MANTKSAEKRNRQSLKHRARNASVRTTVRNAVKKARVAFAAKDPAKASAALRDASSALGKAASKGVLHPRTASRRISRLAKAAPKA